MMSKRDFYGNQITASETQTRAVSAQAVILLAVVNRARFVPWNKDSQGKCVKHYSGVSAGSAVYKGLFKGYVTECG